MGENKHEKAGLNPTIQHIINNLHIKYDYSSLQEIFDKNYFSKYRRKTNQLNTGMNMQEKTGFRNSTIYEGESISNQPNSGWDPLLFFDVIAL